jgi:hypothetical protein
MPLAMALIFGVAMACDNANGTDRSREALRQLKVDPRLHSVGVAYGSGPDSNDGVAYYYGPMYGSQPTDFVHGREVVWSPHPVQGISDELTIGLGKTGNGCGISIHRFHRHPTLFPVAAALSAEQIRRIKHGVAQLIDIVVSCRLAGASS